MSTSLQQVPISALPVERRFYPRIVPRAPIFVAIRESEESLLLNVSENGLLVSTPVELACNSVARLSISLSGLPKPVQVTARVLWSSESRKLAGIQLLNLCEHDRERIRKWGARESALASQPEPIQPFLIGQPDESLPETIHEPFAENFLSSGSHDAAPLPPAAKVQPRSISIVERCATWGLYLATICLAAAFFLRADVLGNPFARSVGKSAQNSAPVSLAQSVLQVSSNHEVSERPDASPPSAPLPIVAPAKSKSISAAAATDSPRTTETPAIHRTASPAAAIAQTQRDDSRGDQAHIATIPAASNAAPKVGTQEQLSAAPDPPAMIPPIADSVSTAGVLAATSPPIPTNPPSIPLTIPPTNSIAAPAHPTLSPRSDASIIQTNTPRSQVLEVRLPRGYQSSFFYLPGERVLESPTLTMHIQRSVLMPAPHGGWLSNRNKKVVVGDLISRIDPQTAQIPVNTVSSVRVSATVGKDGRVENVRLIQGSANLAASAAQALRQWRYQPTLVDDKPVETQCYVMIQFHGASIHTAKR